MMIQASHLTRRFGPKLAVNDISFEIERGEIVGFLGPNGAGKTTTMRMLSCYLSATSGSVTVAGFDVLAQSLEVRRRIGYLPENYPAYPEMRVEEYLRYRGLLKGMTGRRRRVRIEEVLEVCGLKDARRAVIENLSRGYRQRVGLADSLLSDPELLILDEPTLGLDPLQIRQIRDLIRNLADRQTVLLSSHILPEVEAMCRRVLIMDRGRIIASDTPGRLAERMASGQRILAEISGPCEEVKRELAGLPGVRGVNWTVSDETGDWGRYQCDCEKGADIRSALFALVSNRRWAMRELSVEHKNLEDVFVALTDAASEEGARG